MGHGDLRAEVNGETRLPFNALPQSEVRSPKILPPNQDLLSIPTCRDRLPDEPVGKRYPSGVGAKRRIGGPIAHAISCPSVWRARRG